MKTKANINFKINLIDNLNFDLSRAKVIPARGLKNAIEKSYEDCGWNLTKSENEYNDNYYPTFYDVARNIKEIIKILN